MLAFRTVFILGAGASAPFGFPLGLGLKELVLQNYLSDGGNLNVLLNTTSFARSQVGNLVESLRHSGLYSVDAFLERRPEFIDLGKAMMGIELLRKERFSDLWITKDNWLMHLYNQMVGNKLDDFASNRVSFITFNYDRSLEHFLFISLLNSFNQGAQRTARVLDQIPIIHLHGRLGALPWEGRLDAKNVVEYGREAVTALMSETMMDEIKVVHEDITETRDQDFSRAKRILSEAQRVYLLGFGFGARNVERLGLGQLDAEEFVGTAYGATLSEIQKFNQMAGGRLRLYNQDCLQFLRNEAPLD